MDLLSLFKEKFGISSSPLKMVKSPLRICPLGAHVDHQKGLVTGMALNSAVEMIYTANDDGFVQVQSMDFPDEENFHVNNVPGMVPGYWGNYLRGSILALKRSFVLKKGIKALIRGKIPIGGLSSSAAVMTAYLMTLCDVNNIQLSNIELIDYSHWVENNFIGLNNGILDQAANILSKAGHLMFMDTATGEYELIPPSPAMPEYEVVVVYSGISTALISTDYNNRVDECKVSAWILQELAYREVASFKEANLRQVDYESYLKFRAELPERFQKRADHFFSENERVKKGVAAWKKGDLNSFGQLMFASGANYSPVKERGPPMKAIILAAGYATRLYPLTKNRPKPLLEIGGKPILQYLLEKIEPLELVDEVIIVTNDRFYHQFADWVAGFVYSKKIIVLNDGTTANENRLGAIADLCFALEERQLDEDLLVLAGDNLFDFALTDFVAYYQKVRADCITAHQLDDLEELRKTGVIETNGEGRVLSFAEKPMDPRSNLAVPPFYIYRRDTIPLLKEYLQAGENPDAPGNFIPWLLKRKKVYAFRFEGARYDIGTLESYRRVNELFLRSITNISK